MLFERGAERRAEGQRKRSTNNLVSFSKKGCETGGRRSERVAKHAAARKDSVDSDFRMRRTPELNLRRKERKDDA